MSVHQEDMEMVFLQATNYSLKNVTKVNEFRGNKFICSLVIQRAVIEAFLQLVKGIVFMLFLQNICTVTIHIPTASLKSSIDLERKSSSKSIDLERKSSPKRIDLEKKSSSKSIDFNALFSEESKYSCENWNLTLDYASVKQDTFKKEITVKISLWDEYVKCFDFYNVYLYKFKYFECKPKRGIVQPDFFRINPKFNKNYSIEEIFVFPIKKSGYYCILVVPFIERTPLRTWALNSDIFNITVENISSTEIDDVDIKKNKRQNFPNEVILAICILLFITTCSLWSCFKVILKTKIKKGVDLSAYAEENLPILTQIVDKVYIFHSLDDHSIQNDVALLKNFLQECALLNVYTLDDMIHDLLEQRHRCISKILECDCPGTGKYCVSNKKFVIVISERVLWNANSEDIISDHIEERAFQMILDFTAADWKNSYCHLFVVSFNENLFYDKRFKNVVPKHVQERQWCIKSESKEKETRQNVDVRRSTNPFKSGVANLSSKCLQNLIFDRKARDTLALHIYQFGKAITAKAAVTYGQNEELRPLHLKNILPQYFEKNVFNAAVNEANRYLALYENSLLDLKLKKRSLWGDGFSKPEFAERFTSSIKRLF
ncbi:uncharacterized protein CEXT_359103 [Caerostris extrusa]|uniref:SEFIR domain-containing protein n=1 Tax=Caerostris extrusa TaxID=172846 RepID=A0AAV4XQH9_CAEEX|nr:uncharacterized protein CEXT_359103 [Caerostris extrusa]